jgi:ubiquinone/menaquinone biosynthesis C-methylase UbiE
MTDNDFKETSYRKHQIHYDDCAQGGERMEHAKTWLESGNVSSWSHNRLHKMLDPLLEFFPDARWLTVGDGRFGREAHYILSKGVKATASDISDTLLREGHAAGFIDAFSQQNAENLTFPDNEFDFILCKETYHHFPRPMIAVYEMLRVAEHGVILIEPTDQVIGATLRWKLFRWAVNAIRGLKGKAAPLHQFEESGNYVFTISRRELEKTALAMGLPSIALMGINDFYLEGMETEKAQNNNRTFKKVRTRIAQNDLLCKLGLKPPVKTCAVILKKKPDELLRNRLKKHGFTVIDLPENPYIKVTNS